MAEAVKEAAPLDVGPLEALAQGLYELEPFPSRDDPGSPLRWGDLPAWARDRNLRRASILMDGALAGHLGASTIWRSLETAPYRDEVRIKVGGMSFYAMLVPDAGMNDDESPCDQWRATRMGEHPPCWSEGACYASNAEGVASMQPTGWMPVEPDAAPSGCGAHANG